MIASPKVKLLCSHVLSRQILTLRDLHLQSVEV